MPARILPRVDFPAPFSPRRPWHSPAVMERQTPSNAVTPAKVLVIDRNSIRGVMRSSFEPFVPGMGELIDVLIGDGGQRVVDSVSHRVHAFGVFVEEDFVGQNFHGAVAPAVGIL